MVAFCVACETYGAALPTGQFKASKALLARARAKVCAVGLFVASACEWLHHIKVKPTFDCGPTVRAVRGSLMNTCARAAHTCTHGLAFALQSRLTSLKRSDGTEAELLPGAGVWDLMNVFACKGLVMRAWPEAARAKRGSPQSWAKALVSMVHTAAPDNRGQVLAGVSANLAAVIASFASGAAVIAELVAMVPATVWGLPLSNTFVRVRAFAPAPEDRTYPRLPPHHRFNVDANRRAAVVALELWVRERWARVGTFDPNVCAWARYPVEYAKLIEQFLLSHGGQSARTEGLFDGNPAKHVLAELSVQGEEGPEFRFAEECVLVKNPGVEAARVHALAVAELDAVPADDVHQQGGCMCVHTCVGG